MKISCRLNTFSIMGLLGVSNALALEYQASNNVEHPNILFILVDDMGYSDLGCYGNTINETPNIDNLASQGKRFTHMYAGSAVSTPSRFSIITGYFPIRYNIGHVFRDDNEYMIPSETNLPSLLKSAGYHTAHIGKWHLGGLREEDVKRRLEGKSSIPGPLQQGFEYASTSIEGKPIRRDLMLGDSLYCKGGKYMIENDSFAHPIEAHLEDIKTQKVLDLLDTYSKKNDAPFYINLCYDAPHAPYEPAPKKHLSKYQAIGATGNNLYYRSMISHLDECIGRIEKKLRDLDLFDNTIIIFTSDNGPAMQGVPGPFKGGKSDLHEGGIRVPAFIVWNGVIPSNTLSHDNNHFTDFLPTLCNIAGVRNVPDKDGENRIKSWTSQGECVPRNKRMFFSINLLGNSQLQEPRPEPHISHVVIDGKWKLTAMVDEEKVVPLELYDLISDEREIKNILGKQPKVEAELLDFMSDVIDDERWEWDRNLGVYNVD